MSMILVRAPVRLNLLEGGEADEYNTVSATIDKYIYVTVNRPPLIKHVSARYSTAESVEHPSLLKNDRIREALLKFGITSHIDIATFSDVPVKTGLGSPSSFSVALIKALLLYEGRRAENKDIAEQAAQLENKLLPQKNKKTDQYACALGGLNMLRHRLDDEIFVSPIYLDYIKRSELESRLLVFYLSARHEPAELIASNHAQSNGRFSEKLDLFESLLKSGDWGGVGTLLDQSMRTSSLVNSSVLQLYNAAKSAGVLGGRFQGSNQHEGTLILLTEKNGRDALKQEIVKKAEEFKITECMEIPVRLVQAGVEVLMNERASARRVYS